MQKITLYIMIFCMLGCTKKLDLKPDSSLVIPVTVQDFENILDNSDIINKTPALPQLSADDYFIPSLKDYQAVPSVIPRNAYLWTKDIYEGQTKILGWTRPYSAIFYCNSVLDALSAGDITNDEGLRNIKGWALFARAYSFYTMASIYALPFDESTADSHLGIPLKLSANIDELAGRGTLRDTYNQIINDAKESANLLKTTITTDKRNRPSKVAAYAFLSRVYLSMRKYDLAEEFANKTLTLYSTLIDFKTLNKTASSAFTYNSNETIYFTDQIAEFSTTSYGTSIRYGVNPEILSLYAPQDLRLPIYFKVNSVGNYNNKGINSSLSYPFTGLATDEIYLIKAECLARRGQTQLAMDVLNQLSVTRWNANATNPAVAYPTITATSAEAALDKILIERRKALVWRALRWTDIRRLNLEGRNITLTRNLDGQIYTLAPNSGRYALPIPDDEVALSGVEQNVR